MHRNDLDRRFCGLRMREALHGLRVQPYELEQVQTVVYIRIQFNIKYHSVT
jgi:hypothetical protein